MKPPREPWIALQLPERVAALLVLVPKEWPELEHYGMKPVGRGRALLFQASRPTMDRILDRCRYLLSWRREGRLVLPPGDRVQVERAVRRVTEALADHHTRNPELPK